MKPTILVIDDEPSIRDMLTTILEAEGYPVETAPHGAAAVALITASPEKPRIILLDWVMPVMNGEAFYAWYKTAYTGRKISIIILSASLDSETSGFVVIRKPCSIDEVLDTLEEECTAKWLVSA